MLRGQVQEAGRVGRTVPRATAAPLGEVGGEEAERLALVGGQRRAIALEVARDAAAGGTRAVAEGLDAALPLQLWRERDTDGQIERERVHQVITTNRTHQTAVQVRLTPDRNNGLAVGNQTADPFSTTRSNRFLKSAKPEAKVGAECSVKINFALFLLCRFL